MTKEEATAKLVELGAEQWQAEKFVLDVLDYCRRCDFPEALIYVGYEMLKQLQEDAREQMRAPLKKLTQDDTTFEFAVLDFDGALPPYEQAFTKLKPRLNLYRKVAGR